VPPQLDVYHDKVVPEPPVTLRSIVPPSSSQKLSLLVKALVGAVGGVYKLISNELEFVPVIDGLLLITLIKYPVPLGVFAGIVQLIVPEFRLLSNVPILTGDAKEPVASDSWAVYVFPVNGPVEVRPIVVAAPNDEETQYLLFGVVPVDNEQVI